MEISEIGFSLYLDEKILEFLPERNIHKRHKKYLGIKPCEDRNMEKQMTSEVAMMYEVSLKNFLIITS